jgi:hypothetical protein
MLQLIKLNSRGEAVGGCPLSGDEQSSFQRKPKFIPRKKAGAFKGAAFFSLFYKRAE